MAFKLSNERELQLRGLITHYPTARAALLPALWLVQDELGHISDDAVEYIARSLDISPADVYGTVTFYTMFNRRKVGRYHIQLCTNICCWLRGSEQIFEYIRAKLGVGVGETTEDGNFTLSTVECLGACGESPMMMINNEYYGPLTNERVDEILKELCSRS